MCFNNYGYSFSICLATIICIRISCCLHHISNIFLKFWLLFIYNFSITLLKIWSRITPWWAVAAILLLITFMFPFYIYFLFLSGEVCLIWTNIEFSIKTLFRHVAEDFPLNGKNVLLENFVETYIFAFRKCYDVFLMILFDFVWCSILSTPLLLKGNNHCRLLQKKFSFSNGRIASSENFFF